MQYHGSKRYNLFAGSRWVGWSNATRNGEPLDITFEFANIREFTAVHLHANNMFTRGVQVNYPLCKHDDSAAVHLKLANVSDTTSAYNYFNYIRSVIFSPSSPHLKLVEDEY